METLQAYAAIAEICGAITIVSGAVFAVLQLAEHRRQRSYQTAADLCRGFSEPDLARAIMQLRSLPDNVSLEQMNQLDDEFRASAQIVGNVFETMGLLVYRNIASFQIVQELTGGLLLSLWRKIGVWIQETRQEQGNPRFGEWVQWLVERVQENEADVIPAHQAYTDWKPRRSALSRH